MISVQNHPLRLSGSKWVVFLFFSLLLWGCKSTQKVAERPVTIEPIVVEEKVVEEKSPEKPVVEEIKEPVKPEVPAQVIIKDKFLDIVFILPFDCSNYLSEVEDFNNFEFTAGTKLAAEFYSGAKMALEELKGSGSDMKVQVFDNANQINKTEKILNNLKGKIDLIIGPIHNKELRSASEYAKKKKIPIISPLSSSTTIASQNPYYYSANASNDAHLEKIVSFIKDFNPEDMSDKKNYKHLNYKGFDNSKSINIIYFSDATELNTVKSIKKIFSENDIQNQINEIPIELTTGVWELKSKLDSTKHQYFILPLYNESHVLHALNLLSQLNNSYSMSVFGMSTWRKMENINYQYLNLMKVYITSSSFIDKENYQVKNFIKKYKETFGLAPGEYAFQGYDLIQYFYQNHREGSLFKSRGISPFYSYSLHTQFDFIPRFNSSDVIEYYDNRFVHLLQFDNFNFKRVEK